MTYRARKEVVQSALVSPPRGTYSQGIRVPAGSDLVFFSGLTSRAADGSVIGPGDPGLQARTIFAALRSLLVAAGGELEDVVRLTIFVTSIGDAGKIQAEREPLFASAAPASTMVEVRALADPALRIEVEAVAALPPRAP